MAHDLHHEQSLAQRLTRLAPALGSTRLQLPGFFTDLAVSLTRDAFDTVADTAAARTIARTTSSIWSATQPARETAGAAAEGTWRGYLWLTGDLFVDPETGERADYMEEGSERRGLGHEQRRRMSQPMLAWRLSQTEHGDFSLFDQSTWDLAYELSDEVPFGHAAFYLLSNTDILDPDEMHRWADSDWFRYTTFALHTTERFFLDPDVLMFRGLRRARRNYLIPGISPRPQIASGARRAPQINALMDSRAMRRTDNWLDSLPDNINESSRLIKSNLFRRDPYGREKAYILASAPDKASRHLFLRVMYGDHTAFRELSSLHGDLLRHASVLETIRDLQPLRPGQRLYLRMGDRQLETARKISLESHLEQMALNRMGVWSHLTPEQQVTAKFLYLNDPSRATKIQAEIQDTLASVANTDTLLNLYQTSSKFTRTTLPSSVTTSVRHSDFYQKSPYTKPLRIAHERRPHRIVDAEDTNFPEMFDRMLRQAKVPQGLRNQLNADLQRAGRDPAARVEIWDRSLEIAWRSMVGDINKRFKVDLGDTRLSPDHMKSIIRRENNLARHEVRRQYSAGNRDLINVASDDGIDLIRLPIFRSQTPNVLFTPDFPAMRRALERYASKGHLPDEQSLVRELPPEIADTIIRYWKANVLLRGAWPVRVTGFDEIWRLVAKYGAATALPQVARGTRNFIRTTAGDLRMDASPHIGRTGAIIGSVMGAVAAGLPGAAAGAATGFAGFRVLGNLARLERAGMNWEKLGKVGVRPAFGEPGDVANVFYDRASSRAMLSRTLNEDRTYDQIVARAERNSRLWETIKPQDPRHLEDWTRVINQQLRGDDLARRIMRGDTHDELTRFLKSPEGVRYTKNFQAHEILGPDEWVRRLVEEVDSLFPGSTGPQLRSLALERDVTPADLTRLFPEVSSRPNVHGEGLNEALGRSAWQQMMNRVDGFIDRWMKILGQNPTDELVRYPGFEIAYRRYWERHLDTAFPNWKSNPSAVKMTRAQYRTLQDNARRHALTQVRDIAYDLSERTELHQLLRHVHPFLPAVQEVVTTWAGLAIDNPVFATRAVKFWTNLSNINNIAYTDPEDDSEWFIFPIPDRARGLLSHSPIFREALDDSGFIRLPKQGFNLILQSPLGLGPFVQASVSEILKHKPTLEDNLEPFTNLFMPYGPSSSFFNSWLATYQRRAVAAARGNIISMTKWWNGIDGNREYRSYFARSFGMAIADMTEGRREWIDFDDPRAVEELMSEVAEKTNALFTLRAFTSFFAPAQPIPESPFFLHEQALREMIRHHNELTPQQRLQVERTHGTPMEQFIDAFGDEVVWVLGSMSRSNDGVPPDVESLQKRREWADLIERYPEMGGLIIGRDIDSQQVQFSRAVYDHQLRTSVRRGGPEMQRELLSPIEMYTDPDERLGWIKYSRFMDWLDAERISRGLPNLQVKEAEDLAALKTRVEDDIALAHPAWGRSKREQLTQPQAAARKRVEALRAITSDPTLSARPDLASIPPWLDAFSQMSSFLCLRAAQGGAKTLDAASNFDLQLLWETTMGRLVESNIHFGPVYYRWLERTKPFCDEDDQG